MRVFWKPISREDAKTRRKKSRRFGRTLWDDDYEELLQRISIDPAICGGKPCIRGHRIRVSLIVDFLASGMSVEDIRAEYPQLTVEDIRACLAYASEMTRERTVPVG